MAAPTPDGGLRWRAVLVAHTGEGVATKPVRRGSATSKTATPPCAHSPDGANCRSRTCPLLLAVGAGHDIATHHLADRVNRALNKR